MKIRNKILILLMAISVISVSAIGAVAYTLGKRALEQESFDKLTAVREMKAAQIEDYFLLISDQMITFSEDRMIIDAMRAFDDSMHTLEDEIGITDADLEQIDSRLFQYYENEYLPRLNQNLLQDVSVDDYWSDEVDVRVLQDLYITSNPYDTGLKYLLDDAGDGSAYSKVHAIYHPIIRDFLERFGYYDIFLVDVESGGHIAYTVFKEVDFGTSLISGPYSNTNFARAYQAAREATDKDFVYLEDYDTYYPSYNAPAAFIASPIYDGDKKIGVLIFQLPIDRINNIMTSRQLWSEVGLGESGETYIVGDDFLLRNQSRFLIEDSENYFVMAEEVGMPSNIIAQIQNLNSTIGLQEVKTQGTEAALNGETGTAIFPDYRGVSVLSAYKPLNIQGVDWAIISEIDEAEAFAYIQILGIRTILVAVAIFAATMLASLFFSRTITDPLAALTKNTEEVAAGNLDVEIECVGQKDEIGGLANSFCVMQDSIKDLVGDLEDINKNLENLVEERTKELELATERVRTIVEIAPDAVITIDAKQKITLFNPKAEEVFGYSVDEVLGQPLTMLIPEKSRNIHPDEVNKFGKEALSTRSMDNRRDIMGQRKNGSTFPAEAGVSKMVINDETYYTTFFRDISERKLAEEILRESENKHRTIFQNSPLGMILFNTEGVIVDCNDRFVELMGSSREQLIGFSTLENASDAEVRKKLVDALAGTQTEYEGKYTSTTGNKTIDLRIIYNPVNPEEAKTQVIATLEDITERKLMEAQLELANERMSQELNFARDIQMGLLPLIFPAFPTRPEFDIFASLIPAREVGGDFYDFYFIDEDHLCFVVGDVSGKGAPGALLMAVSKTLIKSRAMDDFQPSSILTHVNNELSQNNESAMFVTVFLSIINIRTGKIEYTNAGHNPPYIRREDQSVEKLDAFHGPVIGALPNLHYKESSTTLGKNDTIVLFTDGVTEAMNVDDQLYSDIRLEKFLAAENLVTPQKICDMLVRDVKRHEGDAEQADDITILALKFTGQTDIEERGRLNISIKNQLEELAVVEEQFELFCQESGISDHVRQQVSMVLDEMLNNVVNYAYRDEKEHTIDVEFVLTGARLVITLRDDGVPFNPFAIDPPNIALSLDEREVGGLGIYLVRSVMDEYMYNRHIGRNVNTLAKLIEIESA